VSSNRRPRKLRVDFRKNREQQARRRDLTRDVTTERLDLDQMQSEERVSGKGSLSRRRTIVGEVVEGDQVVRAVDESTCKPGRVLSAIGATHCTVQSDDGTLYDCTVRRVLRTLASDARNVVVTGDRVLFQPINDTQGVIERVEPRTGVLSRGHQHRQHILVANVTQVLIVSSADEPPLKPALIDRFLVTAGKGRVRGLICINKCDLVDPADLQPILGLYSRLGYAIVSTSTRTGQGIDRLRDLLRGEATVVAGQSGVGKSSLLNAIQPGLRLAVGDVSEASKKGMHTTRVARLLQLEFGGWVVDTPGIRQFELWDVHPGEVEGYFVEFRPFVPLCRFPNCLHIEEVGCAVKAAVRQDLLSLTRYESYLRIVSGDA
jgi:ribosome biogenesis GTPase